MSSAVVIGLTLASLPFLPAMRAAIVAHPGRFTLGLISVASTAAAWWWTGERLLARRRDGAWWAIVALALPILALARGHAGPSGLTLLISVLGLVAILTSWPELE